MPVAALVTRPLCQLAGACGLSARALLPRPLRAGPERGDLHAVSAKRHAAPASSPGPGGVLEQQAAVVRLALAHSRMRSVKQQLRQCGGHRLEQCVDAVVAAALVKLGRWSAFVPRQDLDGAAALADVVY